MICFLLNLVHLLVDDNQICFLTTEYVSVIKMSRLTLFRDMMNTVYRENQTELGHRLAQSV